MTIERLNDMKPTTIHIKMDIPFFKIRCYCLPYSHLRMHFFHFTPCCITNPLTINIRKNKQQVKLTTFTICPDNNISDKFFILHNSICLTTVNRFLYCCTGNNLAFFFKMVTSSTKFLQGTIFECFLIFLYKLLPIIMFQSNKRYFFQLQFPIKF